MGTADGGPDAPWRRASEEWFAVRLGAPRDAAAFVVDDPELGVVCSAVGICDSHAPGPANPSGRHGHVFNISTDPRCRRLGYARACLEALLSWCRDEAGAGVVDLHATPEGLRLYRSLGFVTPPYDALQLRLSSQDSQDSQDSQHPQDSQGSQDSQHPQDSQGSQDSQHPQDSQGAPISPDTLASPDTLGSPASPDGVASQGSPDSRAPSAQDPVAVLSASRRVPVE
ncbi:GNAT family N-acetyltransferase [Streptomyces sp. NPDC048639]|uniref:GNAT family N-acetyltransferase n=1 Tax=Streptomyces sp. NPDC048639 TaxID=3365581 RepID=UPI00371D1EC6